MTFSKWAERVHWSILALVVPLVLVGWLGIARYEELTDSSGHHLRKQMVWSALAAVAMVAMTLPSYRVLCRWAYIIFGVSLLFLVIVYFFPPVNGARRWIRVGAIGFQPSEFAKIAFVLALARYLMYRGDYRRFKGLLGPLGLTLLPVLLILREPDLGTSLVFLPVLFAMLFVAGARRIDLAVLIALGIAGAPLLWSQMSLEQKSRVTALFEQAEPGGIVDGDAYHLYQAKQVSALGGGWGSLVLGQTVDDTGAYRLPEGRSDFILCVLIERIGLPGIAAVFGLFVLLAWRGAAVAVATREPFGRLVAAGLVTLLSVQVLINTGMTVGLLPITGLSLPLVSYGGSGMLAQGVLLGLLLNIGMRPGYEVAEEPFRYAPAK